MDSQANALDWDGAWMRGETPWEKGEPAPPLLDFLATERIGGRVFVPGCGLGHDARALADAGAQVVGMDISPTALARAESFEVRGEIRYVLGDMFDLPGDLVGSFDWVVEHTCLSALAPSLRLDYAKALHAALKPEGKVLAIFFLRPWDPGETPDPPPYGIDIDEIDAMVAGRFETLREWHPDRSYPGREGRELCRLMRRIGTWSSQEWR